MNCHINPKIIDYRNYYSGVAIGYYALQNNYLGNNIAIGYTALYVKAPTPASPS